MYVDCLNFRLNFMTQNTPTSHGLTEKSKQIYLK